MCLCDKMDKTKVKRKFVNDGKSCFLKFYKKSKAKLRYHIFFNDLGTFSRKKNDSYFFYLFTHKVPVKADMIIYVSYSARINLALSFQQASRRPSAP